MARIRTIKPDFWTDEKVVELSFEARLFYIGSWNFADDNGNLQRSAKKLKMQIFPADLIDCEPLIQSLIDQGMLTEYCVNGEVFLHIKAFRLHQVINRPSKTGMPTPEMANSPMPLTEPSLTEGKGREGKGKEGRGKEEPHSVKSEELPDWLPEDAWLAFVAMRKKIRAPLTGDAVKLAFKTLEKLMQDGYKPRAVLDQSTLNSWRGLFEVKAQQRGNGQSIDRQAFNDIENARAKALLFGPEVDHAE